MNDARAVFDRRWRLIGAGELEGLLSLYHEDAVLLRFERTIAGHAQLREHLAGLLARHTRLRELLAVADCADTVSYQAVIEQDGGESRRIHGAIMLRGERIAREVVGAFPELSGGGRGSHQATVQIELEPYESWAPGGPVPDPRTAGREAIGPALLAIVAAEGPVLAERAYRLYVKASGGKALTSIARAPLSGSAYRLRQAGAIELDEQGGILRPAGGAAVRVRELGTRTLDEVPPDELAALMTRLLSAGVARDQLPRAVLDAYGLVRMTAKAERLLREAADGVDPAPGAR